MTVPPLTAALTAGLLLGCTTPPTVTHTGCTGVGEVIAASCMPCHSASTRSGGLDFETDWYAAWVGNGEVVPGDAANSSVYLRMSSPSRPMPPSGQVSPEYLGIVSDWIDAGAVCPDGDTGGDTAS